MKQPVGINAAAGAGQGRNTLSGYRRGTVLGLTVAEVFILLLFLLMLAFLVLAQEWRARQETMEGQLSEVLPRVEEDPETWAEALEEFEAPEEIITLRRQRDAARKRAEEVVRELNVLREKGQNPPCWYKKVPDGSGGEREKPLYSFDFAVFDDHMAVRRLEPPPGSAEDDDGTPYAEEARRLQLDRIPYDTPLDNVEVIRLFQPIHDAGKRAQVRNYSCIFWVRVWDETSSASVVAKDRWLRAHDGILEGLFGTFRVTDEPWDGQP